MVFYKTYDPKDGRIEFNFRMLNYENPYAQVNETRYCVYQPYLHLWNQHPHGLSN